MASSHGLRLMCHQRPRHSGPKRLCFSGKPVLPLKQLVGLEVSPGSFSIYTKTLKSQLQPIWDSEVFWTCEGKGRHATKMHRRSLKPNVIEI